MGKSPIPRRLTFRMDNIFLELMVLQGNLQILVMMAVLHQRQLSLPIRQMIEDNFMKDFVCCETQWPTLHDLRQHYEEMHLPIKEEARQRAEDEIYQFTPITTGETSVPFHPRNSTTSLATDPWPWSQFNQPAYNTPMPSLFDDDNGFVFHPSATLIHLTTSTNRLIVLVLIQAPIMTKSIAHPGIPSAPVAGLFVTVNLIS
jgi:hypothetical protein